MKHICVIQSNFELLRKYDLIAFLLYDFLPVEMNKEIIIPYVCVHVDSRNKF